MFNLLKYKIINTFFNKKNINDNDVYILEDSNAEYYENNQSNNDIIIDIPMLEDLEPSTYEDDLLKIQQDKKTLFNIQQNNIYRFVKPRRLYKKYNYTEYPFYTK
jgi:adenylate cyclase